METLVQNFWKFKIFLYSIWGFHNEVNVWPQTRFRRSLSLLKKNKIIFYHKRRTTFPSAHCSPFPSPFPHLCNFISVSDLSISSVLSLNNCRVSLSVVFWHYIKEYKLINILNQDQESVLVPSTNRIEEHRRSLDAIRNQ